MTSIVVTALYLSVPLLVSGLGHMAVVRWDLLSAWKRPMHERAFGANKTWRGLLVMPLLTIPGVWLGRFLDPPLEPMLLVSLRDAPLVPLGAGLGVAYILAELPNSWWKRRLGIPPGDLPERGRAFQLLVDQADSAVGCAAVYALLLGPSLPLLIALILVGPAVHLLANLGLYLVGLRERPV